MCMFAVNAKFTKEASASQKLCWPCPLLVKTVSLVHFFHTAIIAWTCTSLDKMNGSFVHLGCSWLNTPTSFFISSLKNQVTVCSVYLHKCQATKLGTGHSWTTRCFNDFELTETSFTLTTIDRYSQGKMKQYLNVQNCNATALMKRLYQLLWSFFSVAMLLPLS